MQPKLDEVAQTKTFLTLVYKEVLVSKALHSRLIEQSSIIEFIYYIKGN
jgi:hypothetical protein